MFEGRVATLLQSLLGDYVQVRLPPPAPPPHPPRSPAPTGGPPA